MNQRIYEKTGQLLFDTDLLGVRMILGIAELIWAITLLWPGDTFSRGPYTIMQTVLDENAWAIVFLISSITQITIAIGRYTELAFSKIFAGWNAVLWTFIVLSMYLSISPPPAAISGEAALVLASIWVWVRPFILARGDKYAESRIGSSTVCQKS